MGLALAQCGTVKGLEMVQPHLESVESCPQDSRLPPQKPREVPEAVHEDSVHRTCTLSAGVQHYCMGSLPCVWHWSPRKDTEKCSQIHHRGLPNQSTQMCHVNARRSWTRNSPIEITGETANVFTQCDGWDDSGPTSRLVSDPSKTRLLQCYMLQCLCRL